MGKHEPQLGSHSFWEMAALAILGRLASCQSCVEFFYFQSKQNAVAFLDSCAAGGLVEKWSLLELYGGIESPWVDGPTLRQVWFDQAIYASAPAFRKQNLDAARDRIEGTKNAVYNAFHLYFEVLGAKDDAIAAAYSEAVANNQLRHSNIAKDRLNVDHSPVAKLRLIDDGFKVAEKRVNPAASSASIEEKATQQTVALVLKQDVSATPPSPLEVFDYAEELEKFIHEFLDDHHVLDTVCAKLKEEPPEEAHLQLVPVVYKLIECRIRALGEKRDFDAAHTFRDRVNKEISVAQDREKNDAAYVEALSVMAENLESLELAPRVPIAATDVTLLDGVVRG